MRVDITGHVWINLDEDDRFVVAGSSPEYRQLQLFEADHGPTQVMINGKRPQFEELALKLLADNLDIVDSPLVELIGAARELAEDCERHIAIADEDAPPQFRGLERLRAALSQVKDLHI